MQTDRKLITIIQSGVKLRNLLDPDGLLSETGVKRVSFRTGKQLVWMIHLAFQTGDTLTVVGKLKADNKPVIGSIRLFSGKQYEDIPTNKAEVFSAALGTLASIPLSLKRNLAQKRLKKTAKLEETILSGDIRKMIESALSWKVEGYETKEREFNLFNMEFRTDESGEPYNVELSMSSNTSRTTFEIRTTLDIYGLGRRNVSLQYKLDDKRFFKADCKIIENEAQIPSLKTAEVLYHLLADKRPKQKKKKVKLKI